jgi:pterin-4a-carbinolamine dehydratase
MPEDLKIPEGWVRHERPPSLFRRFPFGGYGETSAFLDRLAALSKDTGYYPDVSFGKNYANVTIHARDGKSIGDADASFALHANELVMPAGPDQ